MQFPSDLITYLSRFCDQSTQFLIALTCKKHWNNYQKYLNALFTATSNVTAYKKGIQCIPPRVRNKFLLFQHLSHRYGKKEYIMASINYGRNYRISLCHDGTKGKIISHTDNIHILIESNNYIVEYTNTTNLEDIDTFSFYSLSTTKEKIKIGVIQRKNKIIQHLFISKRPAIMKRIITALNTKCFIEWDWSRNGKYRGVKDLVIGIVLKINQIVNLLQGLPQDYDLDAQVSLINNKKPDFSSNVCVRF
jgi:hypothetical protein